MLLVLLPWPSKVYFKMGSKIKKIAFLLPSLKFGGAERVAVNLAKAFRGEGIQIDVLLMSFEGEFLSEAERNFNVVDLKCNKTYKLPGRLFSYLVANRPDVLISSFWKLNLPACVARLIYPWFKLILWEHGMPSKSSNSPTWLYTLSASLFYQVSTIVVAVSSGVLKDISGITLGLRRKMVVIFNPIKPPPAHLIMQTTHHIRKRVVWVGRLENDKNPGLMLEAFSIVANGNDAHLAFVGDGHLREQLEKRCEILGLGQRVRFLGYLSDPYVEIAASDLLVLSSDQEGFGNVIVEGMFCGLRVVSTDCGAGIHDILLDNRYGTIVPCNDPATLAQAIERELLATHDAQEQINGAQRFLPMTIAEQFLTAIRGNTLKSR